jgi:hypothetical protein
MYAPRPVQPTSEGRVADDRRLDWPPDWITARAAVAGHIASRFGIAISCRALHVAKRFAVAAEISATADRNADRRQRAPRFTLEPEGAYANAEAELTLDTASPRDKVEGVNVASGNFGPFSLGKSVRLKVGRGWYLSAAAAMRERGRRAVDCTSRDRGHAGAQALRRLAVL